MHTYIDICIHTYMYRLYAITFIYPLHYTIYTHFRSREILNIVPSPLSSAAIFNLSPPRPAPPPPISIPPSPLVADWQAQLPVSTLLQKPAMAHMLINVWPPWIGRGGKGEGGERQMKKKTWPPAWSSVQCAQRLLDTFFLGGGRGPCSIHSNIFLFTEKRVNQS